MRYLFRKSKGYTLIEMAVVLVVVGMLVGVLASAYALYIKNKRFEETNSNIENVTSALAAYVNRHGRYPCPSQSDISRSQPGHGMELCAPDHDSVNPISLAGNCFSYSSTAANLAEGVCVEQSSVLVADSRTLKGAVPFKTLNLPEDQTVDGYGYKLNYVVTYSMTDDSSFALDSGAILLVDDNNNELIEGSGGAHFYVFSSGENGAGAYNRGGVLSVVCPVSPAQENENCDTPDGDGIYRQAPRSGKSGNSFFDDQGYYRAQLDIQHWKYSATDPDDITHKVPGKLVIGAPAGADITGASKVDVKGTVYSDSGVVMSDQICDTTASHADANPPCFTSELIGGQLAEGEGLRCPEDDSDGTGQYMTGIRNSRVICEDEIYISCDDGTYIKQIHPDGSITCSNPPLASCPEMTLTVCGEDKTVGTTISGNYGYWISGTCFEKDTPTAALVEEDCSLYGRRFLCSDGSWVEKAYYRNSYPCTCTEEYDTVVNGPCGLGYTGSTTRIRKYICPQQEWQWFGAIITDDCTCDPGAINDVPGTCPVGLNGAPISRYEKECAGDSWQYVGEFGTPCTCQAKPDEVVTINCDDGFSGTKTTTTKWVCPDGVGSSTPGEWDTANKTETETCTCDSDFYEDIPSGCPSGEVGVEGIIYRRDWTCTSATSGYFGAPYFYSSDCAPIVVPECHWESSSSPVDTSEPMGDYHLGDSCTCGVDTSSYGCYTGTSGNAQYYSTCICK